MSVCRAWRWLLWAMVGTLSLAACGLGQGERPDPDLPDPSVWHVAVMLPGPSDDGGWSETGHLAAMAMAMSPAVRVSVWEEVSYSEAPVLLDEILALEVDVVLAHGIEYARAVAQEAPLHPEVWFLAVGARDLDGPNVITVDVDFWEQGYLQGAAAGLLSRTSVIGFVSGPSLPPMVAHRQGFHAGVAWAQTHRPQELTVLERHLGQFHDLPGAREGANWLVQEGAGILAAHAHEASGPVHRVGSEHNIPTLHAQTRVLTGGDLVLGSAYTDLPRGLSHLVESLREGQLSSGHHLLGIRQEVVGFHVNDERADGATQAQKALLEELIDSIRRGERVPVR